MPLSSFFAKYFSKSLKNDITDSNAPAIQPAQSSYPIVSHNKDRCVESEYLEIEQVNGDKVICRGFKKDMSCAEVDIPEGVTEIADYAFCSNEDIVRVNCPESLTKIGKDAFQSCYGLEEIRLPKKMSGVFESTLSDCTKLRRLVVPEGITEIMENALNICESLEEVVIPNTVKKINFGAFYGCCSLKSIHIPDSVEEINMSGTFESCTGLQKIRLPENVRFTWENFCGIVLFYNCSSLNCVVVGTREFSFDVKQFERFSETIEDSKRPWSDEEMKAMLVYCCTPKDTTDKCSVYDVSQECIEKIKELAIG